LRARSRAKVLTSVDLPTILDERAREFHFEGHRRMDLIRFGKYAGVVSYNWPWKGGVAAGQDIDVKYNLFALPASDLNANQNLKQNPGY
jgi:hypothetical protein